MSSVPRLEKQSDSYDEYKTTLEPKYLKIARDELHEDEYTREPALVQMREFIAKHPQIQRCRTDATFLLRFLRVRKFNVVAACEMLEKWMTTCQISHQFFRDIDPYDLEHLIPQCAVVPLGQDNQGRLVITIRFGEFDPATITPEEECRLSCLLLEIFVENETYQVTGMVIVLDFLRSTMAHFGIWTFPKLKLVMTALNDITPFRIKEIHAVQLPKFAAVIAEFCISALSQKLQQRIKFHKSLEELRGAIDESILPTIYGGKQSLEEANEKFRKRALQERERLLKQAEMFIDLSIPSPNAKNSNAGMQSSVADESVIGSFRKLNVD